MTKDWDNPRPIYGASHEWERASLRGKPMQTEDAFDLPAAVSGGKFNNTMPGSPTVASTNPKRAFGATKPSLHFIPPVAIIEESVALGLGGKKYGPYNWNDQPVDATTYYSAAMRHLMAWFTGEENDPDTGTTHLGNVRACMAILIDAQASGNLIDDRPKTASAAAAIRRLTVANENAPFERQLEG